MDAGQISIQKPNSITVSEVWEDQSDQCTDLKFIIETDKLSFMIWSWRTSRKKKLEKNLQPTAHLFYGLKGLSKIFFDLAGEYFFIFTLIDIMQLKCLMNN